MTKKSEEHPGPWSVRSSGNPLIDEDDGVLALRLGLIITSLRACQRFLLLLRDHDDNPGITRDRIWAFLLAVSYLHEARVTLQPRFHRVRGWVQEIDPATLADVQAFISGRSELGRIAANARNQVVFHFDEEPARDWLRPRRGQEILWALGHGRLSAGVLYTASSGAALGSLLPGVDILSEDGRTHLRELMSSVVTAQESVLAFLEVALGGWLSSVGGEVRHGD